MTHLILDSILAIIIVIGIILGIKRGAVKIILSFVAFVVAAYLAYVSSTPIAIYINNKFIVPSISNDIYVAIENGEEPNSVFPDYITDNAEKFGINLENFSITDGITEEDVESFVDAKFSPLIVNVISTFLIFILFILLSIIFNLFVRIFNNIIKHSFVGGINSFLGAVFGALSSYVIVTMICVIVSLAIKSNVNLPFNITEETINSSLFYTIFLYIF